jgi:hypothetical protein
MCDNLSYRMQEGDMSDSHADGEQPTPTQQQLDKAIRSEVFSYSKKAAFILVPAVLAALGGLGTVCWAYIEWRLPQMAGGVPKGAVMAFLEDCPAKEGWKEFNRGGSRVIVGSIPDTENSRDTYPKRFHRLEESGELSEYVLVKAPPREGRKLEANELPVKLPGFIALTYCQKG